MFLVAKTTFWEGNRRDWSCGKSTSQGPNHSLGQSVEVLGKPLSGLISGSKFLRKVTRTAMACSWVGSGFSCKRYVKDRSGKASGLTWTRGTACACARRPPFGTFRGSVGRMASAFSPSSRRSRWWLRTTCRPTPLVSARTLKACALIDLHLVTAGGDAGSSGSQSPDLGYMLSYEPGMDQHLLGKRDLLWGEESMCTTTSAGPLKSLGRIGQARWQRSFLRIGSSGE